jgi:hypothetical protein
MLPAATELGEADLLDHQITGEPASGLDYDCASAVAGDVGQELSEAGASVQVISAAHGSVR